MTTETTDPELELLRAANIECLGFTEFVPEAPFDVKFKVGFRGYSGWVGLNIVKLYDMKGNPPTIISEYVYQTSLKTGKEPSPPTIESPEAVHSVIDSRKEPSPPLLMSRIAGHHWLREIDFDGRASEYIVLQWNPAAKRWSHSGSVATGYYIDTRGWKYIQPCPMPEF